MIKSVSLFPIFLIVIWVCCWVNIAVASGSLGVCAHVTRDEFKERKRAFSMMRDAGVESVRCDFDMWRCRPSAKGGAWDFSHYDPVVNDAAKFGLTVLPILTNYPEWGKTDFARHENEWVEFVRSAARWFKGRVVAYEICNEPNLNQFWNNPNPAQYAMALKTASREIRSVDPNARVVSAGFAGVPYEFMEKVYAACGRECFDALCVHPYTHPNRPEGRLDVQIEGLRKLMSKFEDTKKPIWITEMGWPTHKVSVANPSILNAALKVARPELKKWNVVYADTSATTGDAARSIAVALAAILPEGSRVEACSPSVLCKRLSEGGIDAVVYPFTEHYPLETVDAVVEFVRNGGTLVEFGGAPMYFWVDSRTGETGRDGSPESRNDQAKLRIEFVASWRNPALPEAIQVLPTEMALAAGLKSEPTGFTCKRFFTPKLLTDRDEWIPLLVGKDKNGQDAYGAAVARFNGEWKGRVAVCGLMTTSGGTTTEQDQAKYTARALGVALAEGVETYYTYEFRSVENDPYYSEDHFGIVRKNFSEKPAYLAHATFAKMRPSGSVNRTGQWHNEKRTVYNPEWTSPGGAKAGMIWTLAGRGRKDVAFDSVRMEFYDLFGRPIVFPTDGKGVYSLVIDDSPIYFRNGWRVKRKLKSENENEED